MVQEEADSSGFRTPQSESEEWSTEAHRLLQRYRRAYDFEATRSAQKSTRLKRPFETLETAFQVTCQVMIALLSPRVHPWMRRLSACLRMKRIYPEVLPSPAFSVLVSGFHAKLVLDVANRLNLPPFCWVQYRPEPEEMLCPLTIHGIELNLLGAATGVCIGRVAVELRQILHCMVTAVAALLPASSQAWTVMDRTAPLAALCFHMSSCAVVSPHVVASLAGLLREAQVHRTWLLRTAAACLLQQCQKLLKWLMVPDGELVDKVEENISLSWHSQDGTDVDEHVPHDLLCPITGQFFVKPTVLHGTVFEQSAAVRWVESTGRHPILRGIDCSLDDIIPAKDVEDLCHRLAASRGWGLW
mmetsp:Transcript_19662/g.45742  ORF Transcript_19662/g.45742 Transcript_19662/m.45742 type:complete len:358 (-) Transcript_19662:183-1256(-)